MPKVTPRTKRDVLLVVNLLQTNGELMDLVAVLRKKGLIGLANCLDRQRREQMRQLRKKEQ